MMPNPVDVGQIRRRIEPIPLESPRGYLCRVAQCFSYGSPSWLMELARFGRVDHLESPESVDHLASVLRLDPDRWHTMAYLKVNEGTRFWRRQFFGQLIAADRLNYGAPRVCPACLREASVWWGIWDLSIVSACPGHRCALINSCLHCGQELTWRRPGVEICRCGFDLREMESVEAACDLIAINAAVYQCAGFPVGIGSFDLGSAGFPAEMEDLSLDDLIGVILGTSALERDLRQPQKPAVTDLSTARRVAHEAARVLREWPSGFHSRLCALLPNSVSDSGAVTFRGVYGNFYQYLLGAAHHAEFKFLIDAFGQFVAQYWPGVLRGQHRLVPQPTRDDVRWIPAVQAAKLTCLTASQITHLVREGEVTGIFLNPPKSRSRVECWLDCRALNEWIARRDADLASFISQAEAMQCLGFTAVTLKSLVRAGLVEMLKGSDRGFPAGVYVRRQDVERILAAFRDGVCAESFPEGNKAILLREAVRRYIGRVGFGEFVRAVLSGTVRPVDHDPSVSGVLGFRFCIKDVKQYRLVRPKHAYLSGFLTYAAAAARLGTNTEVVRNLVAMGLLQCHRAPSGGPLLLSARDVENFSSKYVTVKSIADRLEVASRTVSRVLERSGADVLVIPLPGKGNKLFVKKGPKSEVRISEVRKSSSA